MISLRLARAFNMGIKSLLLHPLRSSLTALSMLFGVGAVIAMLAVGEGASRQAQEQFQALGANTIVLESVKKAVAKESEERNPLAFYGLTFLDLDRIRQTLPAIEVSVPVRDLRKDVWYKTRRFAGGRIVGTVPWFADVQRLNVARGRWIADLDHDERRLSRAVVLGSDVAKALFPMEDPIGKTVSISNTSFRVVGELAPQAGTDQRTKMNLANLNTNVYVPIRSLTAYLGELDIERSSGSDIREKVELRQIIIRVKDIDDVIATADALTNLLDAKHPDRDYRMVVPLQAIRQAQESARMFGFFLACIGAISLFVGGIGIMNIMLATVTERTREIGIRRALGARKSHIIMQFLVETIVLTMVGGLFGAAAGISSHWLIPLIYPGRLAIVTSGQVLLSFLISAGVGVAFGLYPAWRAANMDPIEALRHE